MRFLRNVIAIDRVPCELLTGMFRKSASEVTIPQDIPWEELCIVKPARLSYNNKVENKNTVWQTQLVFKTKEELDWTGNWAYRLTLVDGWKLLLGSSERPFPVTVMSQNLPDNLSDSQLAEVTVTYNSRWRIAIIR